MLYITVDADREAITALANAKLQKNYIPNLFEQYYFNTAPLITLKNKLSGKTFRAVKTILEFTG